MATGVGSQAAGAMVIGEVGVVKANDAMAINLSPEPALEVLVKIGEEGTARGMRKGPVSLGFDSDDKDEVDDSGSEPSRGEIRSKLLDELGKKGNDCETVSTLG